MLDKDLNKAQNLIKDFDYLKSEIQYIQKYKVSKLASQQLLDRYQLSYQTVAENYDKTHNNRIEAEDQNLVIDNIKNSLDILFTSKDHDENQIKKDVEQANTVVHALNASFATLSKDNSNKPFAKTDAGILDHVNTLESAINRIKKNKRRVKNDDLAISQEHAKIRGYTVNNKDNVDLLKFKQAIELQKAQMLTRNNQQTLADQQNTISQDHHTRHDELYVSKNFHPFNLLKSDTESCYSDSENELDAKRVLTISFDEKEGKNVVLRAVANQKKFYDNMGCEQNFIELPMLDKAIKRKEFNPELQNKLKWLCESDSFILNVVSHGRDIDKSPEYDVKNLVKLLYLHGLNKEDYQQKGTIKLTSCESGLLSAQLAANELKLNKIGGLTLEGFNHPVNINQKVNPTQQAFKKRKSPAGKLGETLVSLGVNKVENARSKASSSGQYKYMKSIIIPPAKELGTKKRQKRIGPS